MQDRIAASSLMTPQVVGEENVWVSSVAARAYKGTGFNPDSLQHRIGTDAVRYAIAIQQLRDQKRFADADAAREWARAGGYHVFQEAESTCVSPERANLENGVLMDVASIAAPAIVHRRADALDGLF